MSKLLTKKLFASLESKVSSSLPKRKVGKKGEKDLQKSNKKKSKKREAAAKAKKREITAAAGSNVKKTTMERNIRLMTKLRSRPGTEDLLDKVRKQTTSPFCLSSSK